MSAAADIITANSTPLTEAATAAGARIAPTWPLDQLIAVNPWWEMRDRPIEDVAARVALLGHANGHMPRSWFRDQYPHTITQAVSTPGISRNGSAARITSPTGGISATRWTACGTSRKT